MYRFQVPYLALLHNGDITKLKILGNVLPHISTLLPISCLKINGTQTHWALFIPATSQKPENGTLIQLLSTPFTGYGLEFKRHYALSAVRKKFNKHLLGQVDGKWVVLNTVGDDGIPSTDIKPRNEVEKVSKRVEVPGGSSEPLNPGKWTREVVELLVEKGSLDKDSIGVLDQVKSLELPVAE
ncbi:hypothetical protein HYALB_00012265 [Hymenoscyphus albidus]|uniref:Uncharacterized protein n=1 Tax=Hymenoscyphus albidus TaxID=595503 RepID=A0A9N9LU72_9HELO|nr:hypothetical protein HYALB_00012265 [Hymenoscyphus albidus]